MQYSITQSKWFAFLVMRINDLPANLRASTFDGGFVSWYLAPKSLLKSPPPAICGLN